MDTEGGGWEVMRESGTLEEEEGLLGGMQGFRGGLMVIVVIEEGGVVEVDRVEAELVKPGPQ
jgi:hypothetical protein